MRYVFLKPSGKFTGQNNGVTFMVSPKCVCQFLIQVNYQFLLVTPFVVKLGVISGCRTIVMGIYLNLWRLSSYHHSSTVIPMKIRPTAPPSTLPLVLAVPFVRSAGRSLKTPTKRGRVAAVCLKQDGLRAEALS